MLLAVAISDQTTMVTLLSDMKMLDDLPPRASKLPIERLLENADGRSKKVPSHPACVPLRKLSAIARWSYNA